MVNCCRSFSPRRGINSPQGQVDCCSHYATEIVRITVKNMTRKNSNAHTDTPSEYIPLHHHRRYPSRTTLSISCNKKIQYYHNYVFHKTRTFGKYAKYTHGAVCSVVNARILILYTLCIVQLHTLLTYAKFRFLHTLLGS